MAEPLEDLVLVKVKLLALGLRHEVPPGELVRLVVGIKKADCDLHAAVAMDGPRSDGHGWGGALEKGSTHAHAVDDVRAQNQP